MKLKQTIKALLLTLCQAASFKGVFRDLTSVQLRAHSTLHTGVINMN